MGILGDVQLIIIVDKSVIDQLPVNDKCCHGKEQIDPQIQTSLRDRAVWLIDAHDLFSFIFMPEEEICSRSIP